MKLSKTKLCHIGPLSIHTHRWMEAFFHRGYDLSIIADCKAWVAPKVDFAQVYAIPTLRRTNFPQRFVPNTLNIVKTLKRINPNLVHLHVQHIYSLALIQSGYPFLLTSWGAEVLALPNANVLDKSIARIAAARARCITVDAYCLKKIWVKMGIREDKIEVIPFGVDLSVFNPNVNGNIIRRNLRIEEDEIMIISTRALDNDHYNIECLIKAVPFVLRRHQNAVFVIKGAGPLKTHLENLVKVLNVSDHVRFVGLTSHQEVARYLAAANIYVSTSFIDTTSVSLLEAMACRLPPIVTDIEGNREWIKDGVNGFLYPARNYMALAERLIQLMENEDLRRRFGEECIQIVKEKASWETCINRMEAVYHSLL